MTALNYANRKVNLDLVKLPLVRGLDPKAKTDSGWTALMNAAYSGHLDIAKYLVSLKVDWKANIDPNLVLGNRID